MSGIDNIVMKHSQCVDPTAKKRGELSAQAMCWSIAEEIDRLLAIGFVRETYYPELLVKKVNEKWRMCVDFIGLNKACPNDIFPLLQMDVIVDATAGHWVLNFMDSYSRYNQIHMNKSDEEKMAFIIHIGLYCYQVMPFGLKNNRATYQRLVNRMFKQQIGKTMEMYVDNLLMKSKEPAQHLAYQRKTFAVLPKYKMKLNLKKCAFGVDLEQFLSFIVFERGIEMNPETIEAILNMKPPQSINNAQRLVGRIEVYTGLFQDSQTNAFFSLGVLRKVYPWNEECDMAFQELKQYLSSPSLLKQSIQGDTLYVYLAISPPYPFYSTSWRTGRRPIANVLYMPRIKRHWNQIPMNGNASLCIISDSLQEVAPIFSTLSQEGVA